MSRRRRKPARPGVAKISDLAARARVAAPGSGRRGVRPRIFGFTRFSVYMPGSGAWRVTNGSLFSSEAEYVEHLYSDERLSVRFDIFARLAAPIYQDMAEAAPPVGYRHVVHHSPQMPEKWREELFTLAERYPVLLLNETSGQIDDQGFVRERLCADGAPPGPVAWFRVDDDDLLSVDYVADLAGYLNEGDVGRAVSFASGATAVYAAGRVSDLRLQHYPMVSCGLASIARFDHLGRLWGRPQNVAHNKTDTVCPVVVDSRKLSFLRLVHDLQDTRLGRNDKEKQRAVARRAKQPAAGDPHSVIAKFPTLREAVA
ncbi:hypothetical protein GCM10023169_14670 [Georgenia halophila]|uniref:Rhamnosyl transferase n=1 Tax=Georgenia halophila TaxID=620889 RepID=A0ABP8L2V0_9MICO